MLCSHDPMNTGQYVLVVSWYFQCALCTLFLVLCNMLKRYTSIFHWLFIYVLELQEIVEHNDALCNDVK